MTPIRYDILILSLCGKQMHALANDLVSGKGTVPSTVGGGRTVQELELLAQEYQALYDALYELVQKTDVFLENARSNMLNADQSLSEAFGGLASVINDITPHKM